MAQSSKMPTYDIKHMTSKKFIGRFGKMLAMSEQLTKITGHNHDPLLATIIRGHIEQESEFLAQVLAHKVVVGNDKEVKAMLDGIVAMAIGESNDIR